MMNFDIQKLILVNPCPLEDDCYARAMHADTILDQAQTYSSFAEAVKNIDYLVATSSVESENEKRHLRNAVFPEEFATNIYKVEGRVGLVFGREDDGLYNEEIAKCDILLKIPTSDAYLSLNLSHSVGVVLYTLYVHRSEKRGKKRQLGKIEKENQNQRQPTPFSLRRVRGRDIFREKNRGSHRREWQNRELILELHQLGDPAEEKVENREDDKDDSQFEIVFAQVINPGKKNRIKRDPQQEREKDEKLVEISDGNPTL